MRIDKNVRRIFFENKPYKDDADFMKMVDEYSKFRPSLLKYGLKAAMPFGLQYGFPYGTRK